MRKMTKACPQVVKSRSFGQRGVLGRVSRRSLAGFGDVTECLVSSAEADLQLGESCT